MTPQGIQGGWGSLEPFAWASVTKVATTFGVLGAVAKGIVQLEDTGILGAPKDATLADLLSHTAGLAFSGDEVKAPVGAKRIYSNKGIELAANHVERATGSDFASWLRDILLRPLGMSMTLDGSPAYALRGTIRDLATLATQMLCPTVIDLQLWQQAIRPYRPGLSGVLPGYGLQKDNLWGLGVEIRGQKHPHWTSDNASPQTFGHFGVAGSFAWADPDRQLAAAFLGATQFGDEHKRIWPELNEAVLRVFA